MTIISTGTSTPESAAAWRAALAEAALRGEDVVWFSLDGTEPDEAEAREAGVDVSVAHAQERGRDAVGDLLEHAERVGASRIVVGVKHRSPVGKLLLGSAAQQIILEARVPVVCVKPVSYTHLTLPTIDSV